MNELLLCRMWNVDLVIINELQTIYLSIITTSSSTAAKQMSNFPSFSQTSCKMTHCERLKVGKSHSLRRTKPQALVLGFPLGVKDLPAACYDCHVFWVAVLN